MPSLRASGSWRVDRSRLGHADAPLPEERQAVNRHNLGAMMLHDPARIDDLAIGIAMHYGRLSRTRVQFHVIPDNLIKVVARIRAPIDPIRREHDYAHPDPEVNAAMIRRYHPKAELRVVPAAGHWSMYECPQAFNAALLDLLERAPHPTLEL